MANDGSMDEEVFVHGGRLTAVRQSSNSGTYKSGSTLLNSVVGQNQVRTVGATKDACYRTTNIHRHTLFFLKAYILYKYHESEQLPATGARPTESVA